MPTRSANIFEAARELLALPALYSPNSSLSERMRPVQQAALRRPSEYAGAAGERQPARIDGLVFLTDQTGGGHPATPSIPKADASFDPRMDQRRARR